MPPDTLSESDGSTLGSVLKGADDVPNRSSRRSSAFSTKGDAQRSHACCWGPYEFCMLLFICLLSVGTNFIYDFPGVLGMGQGSTIEHHFEARGHEYTQAMNQALYASYSYPNTFMTIVGGVLLDQVFGLRRATLIFTTITVVGSVVFYLGVKLVIFELLLTGRVLLGVGSECVGISQSAWNVRWFKGKPGMALAFGLSVAFQRLGATLNFVCSARIASYYGVESAVLGGVLSCSFGVVVSVALFLLDLGGERRHLVPPIVVKRAAASSETKGESSVQEPMPPKSSETRFEGGDKINESILQRALLPLKQFARSISRLPPRYWMLQVICFSFYTSLLPFVGIAQNLIQRVYSMDSVSAATIVSAYQITSMCGSPFAGVLVDTLGRNCYFIVAACGTICVSYVFWLTLPVAVVSPLLMVILMALGYCLVAGSLFPSVPLLVSSDQLGVAFGCMTAGIAVFGATMRIVCGVVLDDFPGDNIVRVINSTSLSTSTLIQIGNSSVVVNPDGPPLPSSAGFLTMVEVFLGCAAMSLMTAILLLIYDRIRFPAEKGMNASKEEKQRRQLGERAALLGVGEREAETTEDV